MMTLLLIVLGCVVALYAIALAGEIAGCLFAAAILICSSAYILAERMAKFIGGQLYLLAVIIGRKLYKALK